MLRRGAVGSNHLRFYRDAIEALLSSGDGEGVLRQVAALEDYVRVEPLPWSDLFARRGRALVNSLRRGSCDGAREELVRIRAALLSTGFNAFLPAVDAALAM
jgi:hypothetical protein